MFFPLSHAGTVKRGNVFLCVSLPYVSGSGDGKNAPLVDLLVIE